MRRRKPEPVTIVRTELMEFKFLGIFDTGFESGAHCPHCGAEGRYIYSWEHNGKGYSAMAGCYKMLTGQLFKDSLQKFIETLAAKQAKGKNLTGWDKTVAKMLEFMQSGKYPEQWCMDKIRKAIAERNQFIARKY